MKKENYLKILDTGISLVKNVNTYNFGINSIDNLNLVLNKKKIENNKKDYQDKVVFFIDNFFKDDLELLNKINIRKEDKLIYVDTSEEPYTHKVDEYKQILVKEGFERPFAIVGLGGGVTMDFAKAISNLLTNEGNASDYQGWDLVKKPGIYKIGIPSISGTGAEATRTCVMTNSKSGLKLGMNSDYTVFDHIIMDSNLSNSVPRDQYFYTGMDAFIHCIESLNGSYRNSIGDSYSRETLRLCNEVFMSSDMKSDLNREKLMVASYLGGCAIASSYVGIVHPFSAALSVVLKIHHCIANCIVMRAMEEFYSKDFEIFWNMVSKQKINIPNGVCSNLNDKQYKDLITSTLIHEKPLTNALGNEYREILNEDKVIEIFKKM